MLPFLLLKYNFNTNFEGINNKGLLNLEGFVATGNRWFSPALEHQRERVCIFTLTDFIHEVAHEDSYSLTFHSE